MAAQAGSTTTGHVPSLEQFILHRVTQTGRSLGRGAYGYVEVLNMGRLECAGKRMFSVLVDPRDEGADRMKQKYLEECELLSSLRHPNIVQFLGVCYLEAESTSMENLPVLVMEMLLQGSLHDFLEMTPKIPLAKKCSILQHVAKGLVYLHGHSPVVIHRDLTAKNVLLNTALEAKIADMGNCRIVESDAFLTASQAPGTLIYMPPEALGSSECKYNTSLDMFSFGHLSLFTVTQVFPKDILASTYTDSKSRKLMARSEVERRGEYMKVLESLLPKSHTIISLIKECLGNVPTSRPSASEVLDRLQSISASITDSYHEMTRLELESKVLSLQQKLEHYEVCEFSLAVHFSSDLFTPL